MRHLIKIFLRQVFNYLTVFIEFLGALLLGEEDRGNQLAPNSIRISPLTKTYPSLIFPVMSNSGSPI